MKRYQIISTIDAVTLSKKYIQLVKNYPYARKVGISAGIKVDNYISSIYMDVSGRKLYAIFTPITMANRDNIIAVMLNPKLRSKHIISLYPKWKRQVELLHKQTQEELCNSN